MMEKRERRKKIFYVPGMISLVLIPLFCLCYFYKVDAFKVYSCISISFPNREKDDALYNELNQDNELHQDIKLEEIETLRNYKVFRFNNEKSKEQLQLKELRLFVRDLHKKYDTINGAKVHFGAKTDYDTYIEVINIALEETAANWTQFDNNMFILGRAKSKITYLKEIPLYKCGYAEANREYFIERERKEILERNIALFKKNWILFLAYLV